MGKNKNKIIARTVSELSYIWQKITKREIMFEFDQFLGFLAFMFIALMGFWLMLFLVSIVPYWIGGSVKEMMDERKEKKRLEKEKV